MMTEKMSLKREIEKEYFEWLVRKVSGDEQSIDFLYELHLYEFIPILDMDVNRLDDGLYLRREFGLDYGYEDFSMSDRPCSFLEFMVGLASRMNELTQEIEEPPKIDRWFWELIVNLELPEDHRNWRIELPNIIDRVINRKYNFDGSGGLFPLEDPETDQRELEIWYQMNQYLAENYFYSESNICWIKDIYR